METYGNNVCWCVRTAASLPVGLSTVWNMRSSANSKSACLETWICDILQNSCGNRLPCCNVWQILCARPKNVMRALLRPNSGLRSLLATATRLTTTSTIFDNHHQQHPYFAVFSNVRHFSEISTWLSEFARFR